MLGKASLDSKMSEPSGDLGGDERGNPTARGHRSLPVVYFKRQNMVVDSLIPVT